MYYAEVCMIDNIGINTGKFNFILNQTTTLLKYDFLYYIIDCITVVIVQVIMTK